MAAEAAKRTPWDGCYFECWGGQHHPLLHIEIVVALRTARTFWPLHSVLILLLLLLSTNAEAAAALNQLVVMSARCKSATARECRRLAHLQVCAGGSPGRLD